MMTVEQLKNSILQLAMQGKLVEQRPEEGTGENLYKEIKAEKKELIKEGIIKAGKKYDPVSEEEITFDIPETWTWVRLSDVVFNRGQKKPANAFSYIDIGSIDNVHQKLNDEEIIVEPENAPSRARKIVARGDIIYSTVRPYLHNMCVIDREFSHEPIASTGFAAMTCHKGLYNKYLFYYLLSPDFDKYANDTENSKGVAYPAINDQKLYKALVPLPPLVEQKRIVAKIEELMPFVEQYAAANTKLNTLNTKFPEMMKKSILQEAVQGKLVPQDPNDEPASVLLKKIAQKCIIPSELENEINDNYRYAHLVDACLGIYDCPHSTPTYSETFQGYLCLRTRELEVGEIEWDKLLYLTEDTYNERIARYRPRKGDIVYAREGRYGICAVIDRDTPLALGQRLMVFSVNHEILRSKYLFYVLISDFCLKQVTSAQRGMTAAHVNVKDIKKMIVPIPSLKTQDAIINVLDKLLNKIDLLKVKSNE